MTDDEIDAAADALALPTTCEYCFRTGTLTRRPDFRRRACHDMGYPVHQRRYYCCACDGTTLVGVAGGSAEPATGGVPTCT